MAALEDLRMSRRLLGVLERGGIAGLDELLSRNERQLLALPGFGPACLAELWGVLEETGLQLPEDPFGPYVCARHGAAARDASLATFLLCQDCARLWQRDAFSAHDAE